MAPLFQIGEDKYSYKYSRTAMACNGYPMVAPAQVAPPNDVLCLWRNHQGRWVAVRTDADGMDPVNSGVPVFTTSSTDIDDVSEAQTVEWQWYDEREEAGAAP